MSDKLTWAKFAEMRYQSNLRMALGSSSVGMGLPSWIVDEVVGMPEADRERFLDMLLNGAEFLKAVRLKRAKDLDVAKFETKSGGQEPPKKAKKKE